MNAIQSNIFKVRRPPASREGVNRTELRNRADREEQLKVELTRRQRQYELESYSFYSDLFVSRIASHAQNGHALLRRYNLRGLLQSVVGKLLMNQLELIFLSYFLAESDWNIEHETVAKWASNVNQQPSCAEDIDEFEEYRRLLLLLYLSAFAVKYYLNGAEEAEFSGLAACSVIRHFPEIFEEWVQSSSSALLTVQPLKLNDCFKTLVNKSNESVQQVDYNRMVEQLLIISPSYKPNQLDIPHGRALNDHPTDSSNMGKPIQISEAANQFNARPLARKKIKLSTSEPQQDVNSHLNSIFQSINTTVYESEKEAPQPVSKQSSSRSRDYPGLFAIPEDYSQLSVFRARPCNNRKSELTSRLNLQRSSLYDYV